MTRLEFDFKTTPFIFLRHGETDDNREQRTMGQLDKPLNENGIRQANEVAEILQTIGIASIYASSLERSLVTAQIIGEAIGMEVHGLPGLMERYYGIYQGQDRAKRTAGSLPEPDGVESWPDFSQRIRGAMASIRGPSPLLVVAHSGTFRAIIGDENARVPNGVPLRLTPPKTGDEDWTILPVGK